MFLKSPDTNFDEENTESAQMSSIMLSQKVRPCGKLQLGYPKLQKYK
jgi:hypothetical protein